MQQPIATSHASRSVWQQQISSSLPGAHIPSSSDKHSDKSSSIEDIFSQLQPQYTAPAATVQSNLYSASTISATKQLGYQAPSVGSSNYVVSEGLTYNQSQLLDNLTDWGRTKTKTVDAGNRSALHQGINLTNQPINSESVAFPGKETDLTKASTSQRQTKSGTVKDMLHTAESGVRQVMVK